MIGWVKLVVLLLQISRSIIGWLERQQAIQEGQRMVLAKELQAIAAAAKVSSDVRTAVDGMTDDQVDAALRGDYRP